jgi:hypothetical protein
MTRSITTLVPSGLPNVPVLNEYHKGYWTMLKSGSTQENMPYLWRMYFVD